MDDFLELLLSDLVGDIEIGTKDVSLLLGSTVRLWNGKSLLSVDAFLEQIGANYLTGISVKIGIYVVDLPLGSEI